MALTMVVDWARFAPCSGRSLTIFAVGPSSPPPPPCPPPAPPPHPTTSKAAAMPSTVRIPLRRALFTCPPCLIRLMTHRLNDSRTFATVSRPPADHPHTRSIKGFVEAELWVYPHALSSEIDGPEEIMPRVIIP